MRDKIKRFYNDHKTDVLIVGSLGTVYVVGYVAGRMDGRNLHQLTNAALIKKTDDDKHGYLVTNTKRKINTYNFEFND